MSHGYGDGLYGSGTYGQLDPDGRPTLLRTAAAGTTLAGRTERPAWQLAAAGAMLTVLATTHVLRADVDEAL